MHTYTHTHTPTHTYTHSYVHTHTHTHLAMYNIQLFLTFVSFNGFFPLTDVDCDCTLCFRLLQFLGTTNLSLTKLNMQ